MKRKLLHTFITTILLVPIYGVQAIEKSVYRLPKKCKEITMDSIIAINPELGKMHIYGDLVRDTTGKSTDAGFCGRTITYYTNDTCNKNINFTQNKIKGLTLTSDSFINEVKLYLVYKNNQNQWCIQTDYITLTTNWVDSLSEITNYGQPYNSGTTIQNTANAAVPGSVPNPVSIPYPWWAWLFCGFLLGIALSLILMWKIIAPQKKNPTDKKESNRNVEKQPTFGEKSLNKGEVEQIIDKITKKYTSELYEKFSNLIDQKNVNLKNASRPESHTTPMISTTTRIAKETRKVQRVETEDFCGYAQLPQNGDFALTLTQNPERTAFIISKKGSDYFVGLIDDEQTLSQLVQPLNDLKAKGSKIVDFPDGELQGAKKIVCVDRGIFKEESTGRIIPVKPIQIKRG